MGILNSVSKTVQKIVLGDESTRRAKERQKERDRVPAIRMIITDEPRPSHHDQVKSWINGGNTPPDRAVRIEQRIHELHTTDYMAFPQGEGTMGVHRVNGFKKSHVPHDVGQFYDHNIMGNIRKGRK